ncbi:COG3650 family protein [Phenylobacterium immobile]|uniref:COG3650 family protein n=1 Tax=Phenylobacterium immobile TaxID=21 RepID=UPI000ABD9221|nr:hypothetical protein [Phenylobacterium immobile]
MFARCVILPVLVVLSLWGCKPAIPSPAPKSLEETAPPPASAPISDFSGDFDLIGTEPFWNLKLRGGTQLVFSRPDSPVVVATAPGAEIQAGRAIWRAKAESGGPLTATIRVGECSDGMSDRTYAMSAEVEYEGRLLVGCATRPADAAGQPAG